MWPYKTGDLLKEVQLIWNILWQGKKRWPFNTGDHMGRFDCTSVITHVISYESHQISQCDRCDKIVEYFAWSQLRPHWFHEWIKPDITLIATGRSQLKSSFSIIIFTSRIYFFLRQDHIYTISYWYLVKKCRCWFKANL